MTGEVEVRMLQDTDGGMFKKGTTGWMRKEEARLLIENGFAEYVEQNKNALDTNREHTQTITEDQNLIKQFYNKGLSIIPVYPMTKQPCGEWKQYQKFRADKAELEQWFSTYWNPNYWKNNNWAKTRWIKERRAALLREGLTPNQINNDPKLLEYDGSISVAILGGEISGNLGIFDDDAGVLKEYEIEEYKKRTLVTQSQPGHYHVYLRFFSPIKTKDGKNGEVRGEGGYGIAPPSHHVLSGLAYKIISKTSDIQVIETTEKQQEFMKWADEKLIFKEENTTSNPINAVINQSNGMFLYGWHRRFIEKCLVDDHLNELSLKLFAPSVAKTGADPTEAANIIYKWAERCSNEKNAALTVDPDKIKKMIESAQTNNITPMSKAGLKRRHPELYQQLLEKGIITEQEQRQEESNESRKSQADRVYELFLQSDIELFHDQNKTEYARIPYTTDAIDAIDGISETYISRSSTAKIEQDEKQQEKAPETLKNCVNCVIASKETVRLQDEKFKTYLAHLLYEAEGKLANKESISQVILLLKYDAAHGKCYKLFNRVAPDPSGDGSIWLDMADAHNRAYHITKDGWTLESEVPILFRRYEHQKPLVVAAKNGDPRKLLPFVKIGINKDKKITAQNELLLLIQTASYVIPEIAHPVNAMFGCPGSHKSTAQRFIREVFDPSAAPLLRIPRDENAALQVLDHHYIPIFDNLDYLPRWLSDMLCGAVTGTGQESRILYTDAGSFIRSFRRCPMLNGLNLPPTKGDLLNRSILHPTEPNVERRTEKDLETEYQKVLPEILGGFLDVVVKSLKNKDNVCVPKLFRLADFTEWGCALSVAFGKTEQDFIDAMEANLKNQNTADIENNIVADAFLAYCKSSLFLPTPPTEDNPKTATPDVIFSLVEEQAKQLNINTKNKKWPSAACYFTRKLNDSKNAIMASGWNYQVVPKGNRREMEIWYTPPEPKEETPPNTPKKYYENRYCSVECVKFDTKDCVDIHKFDKNSKSKLPVDCPGYQQASPGEEEY